ncbi:PAS domain-containing sensor histidine kinase [Rhizobium sp. RU20A]|uniref:PAS domain-containing sensor histidine kinase n=1 Tax=Rhizobium sp. RU20A TaxID=1907412 RepID=UPI00165F1FBC|nr:PAS domain-containing sensor histidine kinase [Rhizobium sp. RU20A]
MVYDQAWRRFGLFTGWMCILIGACVLTLWIAAPDWTALDFPVFFQMKANTALSMVGLGSACLLILKRRRRPALFLLVPILLFGLAALYQHVFVASLGIDQVLVSRTFENSVDDHGRIPPNTALCLVLTSLAMLLRALRARPDWWQTSLSFVCFTMTAAAVIGYMIALNSAQDWISGTRMSLQTAACFMCLNLTFSFYGSPQLGIYRSVLAGLMAVSTYMILLVFTYVELTEIEQLYMMPLELAPDQANPRFTLSALVIVTGIVYAALIAYLFVASRHGRRVQRALSDQQSRFSAVVDAAADGIIVINSRGIILSVNPACTRLFGYSSAELLGQNISVLMPEPHRRAHDGYLAAYERTGIARVIGSGREVEGRRKDGSLFPIDASVVRIDLPDGTLYSGTLRDISERKASESALLAANAELEEFAYRTSHDLRAPIASAIGMTAIARDMLARQDMERLDETLQRMETGFSRLDHLIHKIMLLTRTRLLAEDDAKVAIAPLVADILETLNHTEGFSSISFAVAIDPELTILNKPSRVAVALANLLSNAIKYRDPAEAQASVEIRAARVGKNVVVTIDDNGIGIEPALRTNLFRMFVRMAPGNAAGSGLGLYIVKKSVEAMGGSVAYEPREKGSRFTLVLPDRAMEARTLHEDSFDPGRG